MGQVVLISGLSRNSGKTVPQDHIVGVDDLQQAMLEVYARRVAVNRQGHVDDIVPRDYVLQGMSADYPATTDGSVPAIEQK